MTTDQAVHLDTIAAIATPLGRGSIGVIRISGHKALSIAHTICSPITLKPRKTSYHIFRDAEGAIVDQGIVIYFQAPHSFTGEDVIELQGHGSPVVLNTLLKATLVLGARLAKPGEFSERAFLNGRVDLTQAEAISDLINASSEQAARAAMRSLQGEFSKQVLDIREKLVKLRTDVETSIDFSEEDIQFLSQKQIYDDLKTLYNTIEALRVNADKGYRLQEGIHLVIAGTPNAGKSSLLNALIGEDRAIVTSVSGTTRDVLVGEMHLDGLPVHILDTAGLHLTEDVVEQEGIKRALVAINQADQILWVVDSTSQLDLKSPFKALDLLKHPNIKAPIMLIRNKIDLTQEIAGFTHSPTHDTLQMSVKTGVGLDQLRAYLKERVGYDATFPGFSARARHVHALSEAQLQLENAIKDWQVEAVLEILAFNLQQIQEILSVITGQVTHDDLLARIFSTFCIGK